LLFKHDGKCVGSLTLCNIFFIYYYFALGYWK